MDRSPNSPIVLSIECLNGSCRAGEWTGDMLQTGDIVDELRIGGVILRPPFKQGKSGVQKVLHTCFKQKETSIRVRVRRGSESFAELQACIVPAGGGRRKYVLRAIDDPNYAVGFVDRTESDCLNLQGSKISRMMSALEENLVDDGYVSYPWERTMKTKRMFKSSTFYSMLFLPKASGSSSAHYNDLDDTLARAHSWLNASQASGAPIVLINLQTESLLAKISGDGASSRVNDQSGSLSMLGNASLYGFEDYHGVDIGVVRAIRLWFSPLAGEIPVEIAIKETDTKLGFAIGQTEEGFVYISSVEESESDGGGGGGGAPPSSPLAALSSLYKQTSLTSRLLVVSRISGVKVLPSMVSPAGAIRCFDTAALSRRLSMHRHVGVPIVLHVFLWDRSVDWPNAGRIRAPAMSTALPPSPPKLPRQLNQVVPLSVEDGNDDGSDDDEDSDDDDYVINMDGGDDITLERDAAGDFSFTVHRFAVADSWV
ncbi:uncharacterized protein LOC127242994 [Andrographis paniculata]|uniref:uncharacterized protein LOC127242994 n=1 Tax=Andrographis paniculata TaxID=175694 RepID=UPI0021E8F0C1|nr:uncharacterized protein LOC127242994 [Andrographis paniculata]